jgi:hypothetical protein
LLTGLTVTVRLAPEPAKTIFATGTRLVFDELAVITKFVAAVSASPMVKAKAEVELFALMLWSLTLLIVGAVFITVKTKVSLVVDVPSFTVRVIVALPI